MRRRTRCYVRDTVAGERRTIARDKWTFSDATHVTMADGFEPGKIYEVVYKAKDPVLAGLGPAAVRDFASYLKYGGAETPLSDHQKTTKRALWRSAFRRAAASCATFVYDGFNQDEKNRQVFDGVWAHIAGAGRGSFNERFAQPSRDGHPFLNVAYPVDLPPFTDNDGMLAKAVDDQRCPQDFLQQRILRILGPLGFVDPHHAGRKAGCADRQRHAHLFLRRIAARQRLHPAARRGSAEPGKRQ